MKAAIVQINEVIAAALVFGLVIGIVVRALDARSIGAMDAAMSPAACHMFHATCPVSPDLGNGHRM